MAIIKKIYLTLIITFSLLVLMFIFIICPLFNQIKSNSQKLIIEKEKIIELEAEASNLEKFNNLYNEVESFLKQVDDLFINAEVPLEFINFLENVSQKNRIEIENLSLSDKKTNQNDWPYLVFQIVCSGTFADFLIFLEKIENSSYLIEVENITISKLSSDQESFVKNIRASFSIKVFTK
jgi:Tfp pilus assembly protein PilO